MRISDWSSDVCSSDLLGRDTVTAQHVPGDARDVQRLAAVVALYERDRLRNKNALVHPAADAKRGLQSERDFAEHVGELDLDQLVRGQRPAELPPIERRSEEHTSELQSLMRISYAVFCLK